LLEDSLPTGVIQKLKGCLDDDSLVHYQLPIGDDLLNLNPAIGNKLKLRFTGRIFCICGKNKQIKKSYQQGYCFPCTRQLARCDTCIVRPDRCHFHQGTCREPNWGEQHCFIEHNVYLANTSGLKVGVTRKHQRLTRWIDQGASLALPLFTVLDRRSAGLIEVLLAKEFNDKTNWRKLLTKPAAVIDLASVKEKIQIGLKSSLPFEVIDDQTLPQKISYPVIQYPKKVVSVNLDKQPLIEDKLIGIKGQYLMFLNSVINLRKYQGYELEITLPA